jgi:hypothetical protein
VRACASNPRLKPALPARLRRVYAAEHDHNNVETTLVPRPVIAPRRADWHGAAWRTEKSKGVKLFQSLGPARAPRDYRACRSARPFRELIIDCGRTTEEIKAINPGAARAGPLILPYDRRDPRLTTHGQRDRGGEGLAVHGTGGVILLIPKNATS